MDWLLPGTVLWIPRQEADRVQEKLSALFLAGGISLSQVAEVTGLETYTVQNWVKRGFLPPPVNKKYSLEHLCRIININTEFVGKPENNMLGQIRNFRKINIRKID